MTKLIVILIALVVGFIGYQLFEYWQSVDREDDLKKHPAHVVTAEELPGLPYQLQQSLAAAQTRGADGLRDWLNAYGAKIQDPRKAWIQLDYVLLITRDNPQEAKRIFNEVKDRTPPSSPVWPRVHDLEKGYQ